MDIHHISESPEDFFLQHVEAISEDDLVNALLHSTNATISETQSIINTPLSREESILGALSPISHRPFSPATPSERSPLSPTYGGYQSTPITTTNIESAITTLTSHISDIVVSNHAALATNARVLEQVTENYTQIAPTVIHARDATQSLHTTLNNPREALHTVVDAHEHVLETLSVLRAAAAVASASQDMAAVLKEAFPANTTERLLGSTRTATVALTSTQIDTGAGTVNGTSVDITCLTPPLHSMPAAISSQVLSNITVAQVGIGPLQSLLQIAARITLADTTATHFLQTRQHTLQHTHVSGNSSYPSMSSSSLPSSSSQPSSSSLRDISLLAPAFRSQRAVYHYMHTAALTHVAHALAATYFPHSTHTRCPTSTTTAAMTGASTNFPTSGCASPFPGPSSSPHSGESFPTAEAAFARAASVPVALSFLSQIPLAAVCTGQDDIICADDDNAMGGLAGCTMDRFPGSDPHPRFLPPSASSASSSSSMYPSASSSLSPVASLLVSCLGPTVDALTSRLHHTLSSVYQTVHTDIPSSAWEFIYDFSQNPVFPDACPSPQTISSQQINCFGLETISENPSASSKPKSPEVSTRLENPESLIPDTLSCPHVRVCDVDTPLISMTLLRVLYAVYVAAVGTRRQDVPASSQLSGQQGRRKGDDEKPISSATRTPEWDLPECALTSIFRNSCGNSVYLGYLNGAIPKSSNPEKLTRISSLPEFYHSLTFSQKLWIRLSVALDATVILASQARSLHQWLTLADACGRPVTVIDQLQYDEDEGGCSDTAVAHAHAYGYGCREGGEDAHNTSGHGGSVANVNGHYAQTDAAGVYGDGVGAGVGAGAVGVLSPRLLASHVRFTPSVHLTDAHATTSPAATAATVAAAVAIAAAVYGVSRSLLSPLAHAFVTRSTHTSRAHTTHARAHADALLLPHIPPSTPYRHSDGDVSPQSPAYSASNDHYSASSSRYAASFNCCVPSVPPSSLLAHALVDLTLLNTHTRDITATPAYNASYSHTQSGVSSPSLLVLPLSTLHVAVTQIPSLSAILTRAAALLELVVTFPGKNTTEKTVSEAISVYYSQKQQQLTHQNSHTSTPSNNNSGSAASLASTAGLAGSLLQKLVAVTSTASEDTTQTHVPGHGQRQSHGQGGKEDASHVRMLLSKGYVRLSFAVHDVVKRVVASVCYYHTHSLHILSNYTRVPTSTSTLTTHTDELLPLSPSSLLVLPCPILEPSLYPSAVAVDALPSRYADVISHVDDALEKLVPIVASSVGHPLQAHTYTQTHAQTRASAQLFTSTHAALSSNSAFTSSSASRLFLPSLPTHSYADMSGTLSLAWPSAAMETGATKLSAWQLQAAPTSTPPPALPAITAATASSMSVLPFDGGSGRSAEGYGGEAPSLATSTARMHAQNSQYSGKPLVFPENAFSEIVVYDPPFDSDYDTSRQYTEDYSSQLSPAGAQLSSPSSPLTSSSSSSLTSAVVTWRNKWIRSVRSLLNHYLTSMYTKLNQVVLSLFTPPSHTHAHASQTSGGLFALAGAALGDTTVHHTANTDDMLGGLVVPSASSLSALYTHIRTLLRSSLPAPRSLRTAHAKSIAKAMILLSSHLDQLVEKAKSLAIASLHDGDVDNDGMGNGSGMGMGVTRDLGLFGPSGLAAAAVTAALADEDLREHYPDLADLEGIMRNKDLEATVRGVASPCQKALARVLGVCVAVERSVQPGLVFAEMPWLLRRARVSEANVDISDGNSSSTGGAGPGDGADSDEEKEVDDGNDTPRSSSHDTYTSSTSESSSAAATSTSGSGGSAAAAKKTEESGGVEGALTKASTAISTVAHDILHALWHDARQQALATVQLTLAYDPRCNQSGSKVTLPRYTAFLKYNATFFTRHVAPLYLNALDTHGEPRSAALHTDHFLRQLASFCGSVAKHWVLCLCLRVLAFRDHVPLSDLLSQVEFLQQHVVDTLMGTCGTITTGNDSRVLLVFEAFLKLHRSHRLLLCVYMWLTSMGAARSRQEDECMRAIATGGILPGLSEFTLLCPVAILAFTASMYLQNNAQSASALLHGLSIEDLANAPDTYGPRLASACDNHVSAAIMRAGTNAQVLSSQVIDHLHCRLVGAHTRTRAAGVDVDADACIAKNDGGVERACMGQLDALSVYFLAKAMTQPQ